MKELDEPPSYFNREVRQSYQMTWWELQRYIGDLRQAGFDVARLSVQLQKKLSFPLIAPDHHPARHPLLDPGGNPRRRGRTRSGSGNRDRVLGGFGIDRSHGSGRTVAAAFGGLGAGYDLRIPGTLFFPEDADVRRQT